MPTTPSPKSEQETPPRPADPKKVIGLFKPTRFFRTPAHSVGTALEHSGLHLWLVQLAPYFFSGLGIASLGFAHEYFAPHFPLMMAGLGSTVFLLFFYPDTVLSAPRSVIGGHILSALVGILFYALFGNNVWSISTSVVAAIAVMRLTNMVHPPAAATPIAAIMQHASLDFLYAPLAAGIIWLVLLSEIHKRWRKWILQHPPSQ